MFTERPPPGRQLLSRSPKGAVIFRPGLIEPLHGIPGQKSILYKAAYALSPLLRGLRLPVTNTDLLGRAMLAVAKHGSTKQILSNADINRIAEGAPPHSLS